MFLYDDMLCPICEVGYLKENKDYTYLFSNKVAFPNCTIFICNICNGSLFDDATDKRIDEEYQRIRKEES